MSRGTLIFAGLFPQDDIPDKILLPVREAGRGGPVFTVPAKSIAQGPGRHLENMTGDSAGLWQP